MLAVEKLDPGEVEGRACPPRRRTSSKCAVASLPSASRARQLARRGWTHSAPRCPAHRSNSASAVRPLSSRPARAAASTRSGTALATLAHRAAATSRRRRGRSSTESSAARSSAAAAAGWAARSCARAAASSSACATASSYSSAEPDPARSRLRRRPTVRAGAGTRAACRGRRRARPALPRRARPRLHRSAASSQCVSSTRQSTGALSAGSDSSERNAAETRKRSYPAPSLSPSAARRAPACGAGSRSTWASAERRS
jgi:hypothetical protein